MLDMGFIRDVRRIVRGVCRRNAKHCFSRRRCLPEIAKLAGEILNRSATCRDRGKERRRRQDRPACPSSQCTQSKRARLTELLAAPEIGTRNRFHAHETWCRQGREKSHRMSVSTLPRIARQQIAERTSTNAREQFPHGTAACSCGDRYRRARHRCRRCHARDQLRAAECARMLCAPDRPDSARWNVWCRHLVLRRERTSASAVDRALDPQAVKRVVGEDPSLRARIAAASKDFGNAKRSTTSARKQRRRRSQRLDRRAA